MKVAYSQKLRLNPSNRSMLERINAIIEEYCRQGYKLTLRQLYYQLVTKNVIPNLDREYKKLSVLLVKGRMAGVVDWDAIEDRIRVPYQTYTYDSVQDAIEDAERTYRLPRQRGQEIHIELWVEKDALSGVLRPLAVKYGIKLIVNRGYSSASAMHDSYERFVEAWQDGKRVVILYLGDHDPSGLDMVRDIRSRTEEFFTGDPNNDTEESFDDIFEVKRIGLTKEQIQRYDPPPNPAKITDPRADWYIQQHGRVSWEVDALRPDVLNRLVSSNVEERIDNDLYKNILEQEKHDKKILKKIAEREEENDDSEEE